MRTIVSDGQILRIEVRSPMARSSCPTPTTPLGSRTPHPRLPGRGRRNGHGRAPSGRRGRVRRGRPARERHPARVLPGQARRRGRRRRGHLARCGTDPRRPGPASSTGHAHHAVRRRPGGRRPVPRVPRRPGTHPPPDRRAPRGDATGPDDRHAESRRVGRGPGGRDRGGSPGRQGPRDRAPRHRQLPEPERDLRPSGR